jgi:hypothetical protein
MANSIALIGYGLDRSIEGAASLINQISVGRLKAGEFRKLTSKVTVTRATMRTRDGCAGERCGRARS